MTVMSEGLFLGQLEAFLEIARLGNVTRAAESLYLTQPALTSRLKRLEQEIGAILLIRDRRGARLTDAGRAFLPYAERAVSTMSEAQRVVGEVERGVIGDLAIAATPKISTYVLPPVMKRFAAENDAVRLSLFSGSTSEGIIEMLRRGEVQLGLCRVVQHPDLQSVALYEEEYVLAVDAHHPLADAGEIDGSTLAKETLVTLFRSASYREFMQALLSHSSSPPRSIIDLDNPETMKLMISETLGVGLFPKIAIELELASGSLREIRVREMPRMHRTMGALRLRNAPELSAVRGFLGLVRDRLVEMGLQPRARKRSRKAPRLARSRQIRGIA